MVLWVTIFRSIRGWSAAGFVGCWGADGTYSAGRREVFLRRAERWQSVGGVSTSPLFLNEDSPGLQVLDVSEGGVWRAFGELGVFGGGEFPFKPVEQTIDHGSLAVVPWCFVDPRP